MKKTKAAIATGIVVASLATGAALIPENPENLPIRERIAFYENILGEKEANGEGTTITIQKIIEFRSKLQ